MTRVESERAQEAQQAEKARNKATQEQADNFKRMVEQKQQQGHEVASQNRASQQRQMDFKQGNAKGEAQNALLARQGIAASKFTSVMHDKGVQRGEDHRGDVKKQDKSVGSQRQLVTERDNEIREEKIEAKKEAKQDKLAAISRDDQQERSGGGGGSSMGGGADSGGGSGHQSEREAQAALASASGPVSVGGASAAQAASPTPGASSAPSPQQIAAELAMRVADKMSAGFTATGQATAIIELNQGVLSGARLQITPGADGKISIKLTTDDVNVARLVDSSSTRGELMRRLEDKGLTLGQLDVERTVA